MAPPDERRVGYILVVLIHEPGPGLGLRSPPERLVDVVVVGFCIVVDEIRNLLVKSTAIVQNFGKLIINSNENIIKGQKIAEQIMEIIDDFQEKHTDLAEKLSKVEKSSHDQLEIIKEVDLELTEFSDEMQNSELKIDENSSIINELSEQLKTLNEEISKFKIVNFATASITCA